MGAEGDQEGVLHRSLQTRRARSKVHRLGGRISVCLANSHRSKSRLIGRTEAASATATSLLVLPPLLPDHSNTTSKTLPRGRADSLKTSVAASAERMNYCQPSFTTKKALRPYRDIFPNPHREQPMESLPVSTLLAPIPTWLGSLRKKEKAEFREKLRYLYQEIFQLSAIFAVLSSETSFDWSFHCDGEPVLSRVRRAALYRELVVGLVRLRFTTGKDHLTQFKDWVAERACKETQPGLAEELHKRLRPLENALETKEMQSCVQALKKSRNRQFAHLVKDGSEPGPSVERLGELLLLMQSLFNSLACEGYSLSFANTGIINEAEKELDAKILQGRLSAGFDELSRDIWVRSAAEHFRSFQDQEGRIKMGIREIDRVRFSAGRARIPWILVLREEGGLATRRPEVF